MLLLTNTIKTEMNKSQREVRGSECASLQTDKISRAESELRMKGESSLCTFLSALLSYHLQLLLALANRGLVVNSSGGKALLLSAPY